jgi:hypothetical protein
VAQPVEGSDVAEACLPSMSSTLISYWLDSARANGSCGGSGGGGGGSRRAGSGKGSTRPHGGHCCKGS